MGYPSHEIAVVPQCLSVFPGVAGDLMIILFRVGPQVEVVAVVHGSERCRHGYDQHPVLDQVEIMDDLGAQKTYRVGERGEVKAGVQLLGDCRPADDVASFPHPGAEAGLSQVSGVDQPVVAPADHNCVIARRSCHFWISRCDAVLRSG